MVDLYFYNIGKIEIFLIPKVLHDSTSDLTWTVGDTNACHARQSQTAKLLRSRISLFSLNVNPSQR